MGYEVIIGKVNGELIEEGRSFFMKIGSFDLSEVNLSLVQNAIKGKGGRLLARMDEVVISVYFYDKDGNTKITKDLSGDKLIAFEPEILLEEMKRKEAEEHHHRFPSLIAMLESMLANFRSKFYVILFCY